MQRVQRTTPAPPALEPWPTVDPTKRSHRARPSWFERLITAFSWSPIGDQLTWTAAQRSQRTRSQVLAVLLMAALVSAIGVELLVIVTHDYASLLDTIAVVVLLLLALFANRRGGAWSSIAGVVLPLAVIAAVFVSFETPTTSGRLALSWVDTGAFSFFATAATFAPAVLSRRLALPIVALAVAIPIYFLITSTYASDMVALAVRDGIVPVGTSVAAARPQLILFIANRTVFPTLAGALTTLALAWFVRRDHLAYDAEIERANTAQRETKAVIEQDIGFARLLRQLHQDLRDGKPLAMSSFFQRNPALRGSAIEIAYTELYNFLIAVGFNERRRQAATRDLFAGQQAIASIQVLREVANRRRAQMFSAAIVRTLPPLLPQGAELTDPAAVLLVTDLTAVQERFVGQLAEHEELYLRWLTTKPRSGQGYAELPPQLFYGPLYLLALNTAQIYGLSHPAREHVWDDERDLANGSRSSSYGGSQPGSPVIPPGVPTGSHPGTPSTPALRDEYPDLFQPFGRS